MRGHPRIEGLLTLALLAALTVPLRRVSHPAPVVTADTAPTASLPRTTADLHVRSTHPLAALRLLQDGDVVAEFPSDARGDVEWESEVRFLFHSGRPVFDLEVQWDGEAASAYCELTLEPEAHHGRRTGVWGRGATRQIVEFVW